MASLSSENPPSAGLDFGTSTTLVASPRGVLPIGDTYAWMPSLVGYDEDGQTVVGEAALEVDDDQLVRSIKRFITEGRTHVRLDTPTGVKDIRADDLMVRMLEETVSRAADRGLSLATAMLGCPAMWDGEQRRRLQQLAQRAGLQTTLGSLVDEPVAAGIAWLSQRRREGERPRRVLVFDMGGGTLDIAVLQVRGDEEFAVLAALGVDEAGNSLDDALAEDLEYVLAAAGVDVDSLQRPARARARLQYAARDVKVGLSTVAELDVKLPRREFGIASVPYTRKQLNEVFAPQMDRAISQVVLALQVARLLSTGSVSEVAGAPVESLVEDVDVVVLSGGMSQIPYVAQRLSQLFPGTTSIEPACAATENAVALGLARCAGFGRVNKYRPAFDIVLEWDQGREQRTLYAAYTPLLEQRQLTRGESELRYVRDGADLKLPSTGKGVLRVLSHGDPVSATIGGSDLDGFEVAWTDRDFEFSIFPDGRLHLSDANAEHAGQLAGWR